MCWKRKPKEEKPYQFHDGEGKPVDIDDLEPISVEDIQRIFEDFAKKYAIALDHVYLEGLKLLSERKKHKIFVWILKAVEKEKRRQNKQKENKDVR